MNNNPLTFEQATCAHEWVNVSLFREILVCKKCSVDKEIADKYTKTYFSDNYKFNQDDVEDESYWDVHYQV